MIQPAWGPGRVETTFLVSERSAPIWWEVGMLLSLYPPIQELADLSVRFRWGERRMHLKFFWLLCAEITRYASQTHRFHRAVIKRVSYGFLHSTIHPMSQALTGG